MSYFPPAGDNEGYFPPAAGDGGGGVTDGDKGDVVVSGGGTVWELDPSITFPTGGTATLDFGAAPGTNTASIAVTGQTGILSGSRVRAWIMGSNADHNAYEHQTVLPLYVAVTAGTIVAGTGFTIYGTTDQRLTGDVSVAWEWA